ncbi:MAG TPA: carboxypeptidase-like regulatory domain-containing protein [Thermoanaerobaculia bacterium]|nr:carboxypeptidase-like regulatory domain-containing protein [Thermoanaerobaculia bacterium]
MRTFAIDAIIAAVSVAAAPRSGSISGRVVDNNDKPLAGAHVSLNSGEPKTTGSTGRFAFPNLAPGHYDVSVERDGFDSTRQRFEVKANSDTAIEIKLRVRR